MHALPLTVKIGWKQFSIVVWDHAEATVARRFGECDHNSAIIRIDTYYGHRQAAETLMHEILHAAYNVGSLTHHLTSDEPLSLSEERVIDYTASWIMTIFTQNPDLVRYFSWVTEAIE